MASEFIGLAVLITLKAPNNTRLHGTIVNILNKDLVLANVTFLNNGYKLGTYTVQGPMIENLDVVPPNYTQEEEENIPPPQLAKPVPTAPQGTSPAPVQASQPTAYTAQAAGIATTTPVAPLHANHETSHQSGNGTTLRSHQSVPVLRQTTAISSAIQQSTSNPAVHVQSSTTSTCGTKRFPTQRTHQLEAPFQELSIKEAAESSAFDETDDALSALPAQQPAYSGKRSRRGGKGKRQEHCQDYLGIAGSRRTAGNGNALMRNGKHQRRSSRPHTYHNGDEEGWATEDINDIRDTEFDFQGNLERFDKKTVFSQIRAEDTTLDEARLVSFNRLPQRVGAKDKAPARKNYRNTENVLGTYTNGQPLEDRDSWNSPTAAQDDSTESDGFGRGREDGINSGRSSRRGVSRSVPRRPGTKQSTNQGASSSGGVGPNPNTQETKARGTIRIAFGHRSGHGISPLDVERNKICPIVSPLQMLDVERIAETEMGLEEILMTENAARGIASVAIQAFGTRLTSSNHNPLPVVLVFAGNNKSGARAIAAGRHLKNHHVRVMVCVVGLDREDELLENVRRQLNMFRNAGGRVARLEELANSLKAIDAPPELIIDGILGIHISFEELRTDDQATAFELVNFANKSSASVLAIDVPSGIDGHTGEIAQIEDTGKFHMRAKWVVALGAPKTGLLQALDSGVGAGWKLFVADIGIPSAAWRKYGSRRRHGVEFGADWVVPLEHIVAH
ncbi:YjeF N-terminal domain-containing protein [Kalaharituber pfeilii]|nr:YjeF N-terminal domain-containing protein [Kalaharituber pfeilii]